MKKLTLIILIFAGITTYAQNVLRVNNIPGINAPYNSIQAAVDAASAGDIILVEGSPYDYSTFNLNKRVTIKGPGYLLDENTGIQATQNIYPAKIAYSIISLFPGSEGSVVSGLTITQAISIQTSNITISNNRFFNAGIDLQTTVLASNILITGNYMAGGNGSISLAGGSQQTFTNVVISNNLIGREINFNNKPVFATIKNNIIGGETNYLPNCDVADNIFTSTFNPAKPPIDNTTNASIRNNVFVATSQPGADGTNVFNQSTASLFIGLTGNTTDTQWKLKAGSPAIGVGEGGIDCGMYGGITPYRISGVVVGQPTITAVTVPGNVSQNGTLNVKVSAKVN